MANQVTNQQLLAKMNAHHRLSHAYIFAGEQGTGRFQTAQWLACDVLCPHTHDGEPCLTCQTCRRIMKEEHPDVWHIRPDGKTIRTQQITTLKKELSMSGLESNRQVFIIEQADAMTESAANQLLKFIEEPATPMLAILLVTNRAQLLPTIVSRCQLLTFSRPPLSSLEEGLKEAGVSSDLVTILPYLTSDVKEAISLSEDDAFQALWQDLKAWYVLLAERQPMSFVNVQATLMAHIKGRKKTTQAVVIHQRVLDLLMIMAKRDYMETKQPVYRDLLDYINEARQKSQANVNFQHVLEQLAYHMMKGGR